MTSELVTNAILHAKTDIDLVITVDGCQARLEVSDQSEGRLAPVEVPAWDDTSGRGLFVVTALADDWGVVDLEEGQGKMVWIQLAVH
jgi:anti-sigma regulatory factor (Ser/Thr protein kinase)